MQISTSVGVVQFIPNLLGRINRNAAPYELSYGRHPVQSWSSQCDSALVDQDLPGRLRP
jgi:hypothetical protein